MLDEGGDDTTAGIDAEGETGAVAAAPTAGGDAIGAPNPPLTPTHPAAINASPDAAARTTAARRVRGRRTPGWPGVVDRRADRGVTGGAMVMRRYPEPGACPQAPTIPGGDMVRPQLPITRTAPVVDGGTRGAGG